MVNVKRLAAEVTKACHAKGGAIAAKEVNIAQSAEVIKHTLKILALMPACDVGALLLRYAGK